MKNLFSSPRATRLLAAVIAGVLSTLAFAVMWMWPYNTPDSPGIIAKLCVLVVFSSIYLWQVYDYWKAWLVEYKYGLRLLSVNRCNEKIDQNLASNSVPVLSSTSRTLEEIDQPVKEKLRFPWPSFICCSLLYLSLILGAVPIPGWQLLIWAVGCALVYRPFNRWGHYLMLTNEIVDAQSDGLLPLVKHLTKTDDSNFYRFHEKRLTKLGFQPLGKQRYRHFFSNAAGDVIAILGREKHGVTISKDYMSLISIDEQGCIHESSSLNHKYLQKWADCHELWRFQTLDTSNVVTALMRHQEFATSESSDQQFVVAKQHRSFAKYFLEVTTNAKVRFYNEYRVAFA